MDRGPVFILPWFYFLQCKLPVRAILLEDRSKHSIDTGWLVAPALLSNKKDSQSLLGYLLSQESHNPLSDLWSLPYTSIGENPVLYIQTGLLVLPISTWDIQILSFLLLENKIGCLFSSPRLGRSQAGTCLLPSCCWLKPLWPPAGSLTLVSGTNLQGNTAGSPDSLLGALEWQLEKSALIWFANRAESLRQNKSKNPWSHLQSCFAEDSHSFNLVNTC